MTFDEWRETLKAYYSYRGSAPHIKGVDFHAEWTCADGTHSFRTFGSLPELAEALARAAFEAGEAHKEWQYINNYKDVEVFKTLKSIIASYRGSSDDMVAACAWLETACDIERQNEEFKEQIGELQEAAEERRWHYPRKGELPEECSDCLVLTENGFFLGFLDNGVWYSDAAVIIKNPLAWQYLPAPPKGKEREQ